MTAIGALSPARHQGSMLASHIPAGSAVTGRAARAMTSGRPLELIELTGGAPSASSVSVAGPVAARRSCSARPVPTSSVRKAPMSTRAVGMTVRSDARA